MEKSLQSKSQLALTSKQEVLITYPRGKYIVLGQVVNLIFMLIWIGLFLSIVTEFITWSSFFMTVFIGIIVGVIKFQLPSNGLKEIILKPDQFQFNYYNRANNREKSIRHISQIDFHVNVLPEQFEVLFLGIKVTLHEAEDLPLLIDKVAEMFEIEYYDTCRLASGKEVLMYKSKSISQPTYGSLINLQKAPEKVKIYDMLNQGIWCEINGRDHLITCIDNPFNANHTTKFGLDTIAEIQIIISTGKHLKKKNQLIINVLDINNIQHEIFRTEPRKATKELVTLRDAMKIEKTLKAMTTLKNIKIVRLDS